MRLKEEVVNGFCLNIRILYEHIEEKYEQAALHALNDNRGLLGTQFYTGQGLEELSQEYIYICRDSLLKESGFPLEDGNLIVLGELEQNNLPLGCSCIVIPEQEDMFALFNSVQGVFSYYVHLERRVNAILNQEGSVHDITALAMEHFQNPLFVHDEYFHILTSTQFYEDASIFTYNKEKKIYMQDADTINLFRTSPEYRKTLTTVGGHFWESDFNESRAIYVNIWIEGNYRGRFVLSERVKPLKQRELLEASYFAEAVKLVLQRRTTTWEAELYPIEKLIVDVVNGKKMDHLSVERKLCAVRWDTSDQYVCGILSFDNTDVTKLSIYSICADIEERVGESYACYHNGYIYLLVNMTKGGLTIQNLRMKMTYIVREGLLRVGVSDFFTGIYEISVGLKQANIALQFSKLGVLPGWYNEFQSCVLQYWLKEGLGEFTKNSIIPNALRVLIEYDRKHSAKLYLTLKTYLVCERNSTLTAQILKIHRSTLPYRLERVEQLTGFRLDEFDTRLYLMMSFYIQSDD